MIDTHTHLYMENYDDGNEAAVRRALDAGVRGMVLPGVCPLSFDDMMRLHESFPENTRVALGLHPTEVYQEGLATKIPDEERRCTENWEVVLDRLEPLLTTGRFAAIGETGIDLYWDKSTLEIQKRAFARQLRWGMQAGLPVIIHCREGLEPCLEVIEEAKKEGELPTLIFHSFTYGPDEVKRIREVCDPYFGINGVATFKNAAYVRDALHEIGIDRILLETDAPFLAPVPYRGKRNESSYIPLIMHKIAETLALPPAEVERITDASACRIFGF